MKPIGSSGPHEGAEVAVVAEARNQDDSTTQGDSTMLRAAAGAEALVGQAQDAISVAPPTLGERVVVESAPGAVYLLEFAPEDATFVVEGDDIVMTFDVDGDGAADSHIVFLGLAGMAGAADAPTLKIAGIDYDVSSLIDTAEALEEARDLADEPGVAPSGPPPQETAGGPDDTGQPPRSGGSSQYEDDLGSQAFSDGTEALSGVGAPLGADSGPSVITGKVITGLPRPATQDGQITTRPGVDSDGDNASAGGATGDGDGGGGVETIAGQVVDGYVANATVFRDANGNGALDDDEVFTTTDTNGDFTLTGGSGSLVAIGGTDISTGLAFDGVLKAPEGSTVITPLTTLVQQLVESDPDKKTTAAEAESKVKKALGINESFQISKTDPVKAAGGGDTEALKVVKVGIAVANTAKQVKSALKGGGASNDEAASNSAFNAIAKQIEEDADDDETTDLTDTDKVVKVVKGAASTHKAANPDELFDVDDDDATNAAKVIKATNQAVNEADSGAGSATEALTKLAKVAQVAQGGASDAIENAVRDDDSADAFENQGQIEDKAIDAEIGPVAGSDALTEGPDNPPGADQADSFDGLGGDDTLDGAGGNDVISGGAGNDLIYGGTGNDVLSGGTGDDTLYGGADNDDITGDAGDDLIYGDGGNDTLAGGAGNDTIYGGAGDDVVRFDGRVGEYSFDFAADGTITVTKLATNEVDTLHEVEHLRFANGKSMTITDTEVDISKLGSVNVAFGDLSGLTKITTATEQKLQLDGAKLEALLDADADATLTIAGSAAVNVVNAELEVPNAIGEPPTVKNLLALEFDGEKSRIPDNLMVDDSHTDAFAAFWVYMDEAYVDALPEQILELDRAFVHLGNDYVAYLNDGGAALLDLVKVSGSRLQTLHDNLLGNLNDGPIKKRFTDEEGDDPRTTNGEAFGDRPVHDGSIDTGTDLYSDASFAARTIGWDLAQGINLPDELPAPYGVLDEGNTLSGTAEGNSQTDGLDFFYGGGGDDDIDGGTGDDTAVYLGSRLDYTVSGNEDGKVTVTNDDTLDGGDEGTDTLTSIETLQFEDGTLSFGATLARAAAEADDGNDGFHPGTGNSDVNFTIHDNTEAKVEAATKVKTRFVGDLESEGLTYHTETGTSAGTDIASWNFDYSIVDYSDDADISRYEIDITADFINLQGIRTEGIMSFDADAHEAEKQEGYYDDPDGGTSGLQNSQNIAWYSSDYDPSAPGSYIVVLTVTDKDSGEVVAQTEIRVEVAANLVVGEGEGEFATIQAAIDAASDGDTIYVKAGTYDETLTINKQVTLLGAFSGIAGSNNDSRSDDGETVIEGGIYLRDGSDGTTIDGFTIQNGDVIAGSTVGIYLENAENVTIENNAFVRDGEFKGYRAVLSTSGGDNAGATISDNSFTGWGTGVYLNPGATDAQVTGNDFDGNNVGVSVDGPDGAEIAGNSFTNNAYEGLGLGPGAGDLTVTLTDNSFSDNGADTDGRNVGIWANDIVVVGHLSTNAVTLELQNGVSNIELAGDAAFTVIGNDDDNEIVGNTGDNVLQGSAGNDTLIGSAGSDTLEGDDGDDLLIGDGYEGSAVPYTVALYATDFEDFGLGAITDGHKDWRIKTTAYDQEIVDLDDEHGQVFRMSSDPTSGGFAGPYSPPVQIDGEAQTVGEPQTTADFSNIVLSYDFKAVSDTPDSSRLEVDFSRADGSDRNNFLVLEWDASVGLRVAVNEPTTTYNEWFTNDFTAFTGNRTLVDGLDGDGAQWHRLQMELQFLDGPDNDVINIYLDGDLIGSTTTFENYRDWLLDGHAANAEANQSAGLFFRPGSGGGAAQDGEDGDNQGFYFDNVEITAFNSDADSLVGGIGADTLVGGDGGDLFVYTDTLDARDVIEGFDAAEDRIDLDKLLDTLGVDAADREGRIDIDQAGPNANATISVDTDTDSDGFEVTLVTVTDVTGTLTIDDNLILGM